ncbi:histone acetyltransferase HAC1 [Gossypium australe]|uniref:Histone acetyltransferase HAC1 n=1 Tax=Gossypium australe TaxID=47621 RepID=A0A5B6VQ82_9ROSI|nr:histone acetyltransferase HAC1 [Gossypium australe]
MHEKLKPISTLLVSHFKLSASMLLKNDGEQEYMSKIPYENVVGCGWICDSDYVIDLNKRQSTTSYVFTLTKAPVSWKSTLQ